jgi:hypothetical protein
MRKWLGLAIACLGCSGIFEENPAFTPDSDGSTTGFTTSSSAATSGSATMGSGSASGSSASSSDSGDVPQACAGVDMYEPNDSASQLAQMPGVTSEDVVAISAEIDDSADEDWFKVPLEQAGAMLPQPTVSVSAPEPMRVCVYVGCSTGETTIDCGSYTPHTNGGNSEGCCGEDLVSASYGCTGAVELDASTYLGITTAAPVEACVPYDLDYDFGG